MRRLFNILGIDQKAAVGVYSVQVVKEGHPSPPKADEPICTRSQLLAYYDSGGKKVAEAHRYLRTDGTIGASGKADPKVVWHDGACYMLDTP